jgi:hypothetical protein
MAVDGSAQEQQLSQIELMGHLFRRAGFGATRDELEAALAKGYEATLEELLHPEQAPDLEEDILFRSFPDFHETRKVDVAAAALGWRMIHTQRPLEEKMVLFRHCLFATGNAKVENPLQMAPQIETFRRMALSDFRTILLELSKDPAQEFIEASPDVAAKRQHAANLEAEKHFWGAVSVRVDDAGRLYVAEHSRHRIRVYE